MGWLLHEDAAATQAGSCDFVSGVLLHLPRPPRARLPCRDVLPVRPTHVTPATTTDNAFWPVTYVPLPPPHADEPEAPIMSGFRFSIAAVLALTLFAGLVF